MNLANFLLALLRPIVMGSNTWEANCDIIKSKVHSPSWIKLEDEASILKEKF